MRSVALILGGAGEFHSEEGVFSKEESDVNKDPPHKMAAEGEG